jgi:ribulose-5-phosphate 4-epimerase/fuculose-1-phosphate aldolase
MIESPQKINIAATRLMERGLLKPGDSLSRREAGTDNVILLTVNVNHDHVIETARLHEKNQDLNFSEAQGENPLHQHLTVYQTRKDVGAIVLNRQPWATALHELGCSMPGIFDEQIRHLGTSVARLKHKIITPANCEFLRNGENAFVLDRQVLCLGMTLDRAVFNAELLEKCTKAFVLASSTGKPVGKIPWLIRWIANGRLMKDERYAAQQYARGQVPVFKSAY